jgi:hypothetical protein
MASAEIQEEIASDGFEGLELFKSFCAHPECVKRYISRKTSRELSHLIFCNMSFRFMHEANKEIFMQYEEMPYTQGLPENTYLEFANMIKRTEDLFDVGAWESLQIELYLQKGITDGRLRPDSQFHEANNDYINRLAETCKTLFQQKVARGGLATFE